MKLNFFKGWVFQAFIFFVLCGAHLWGATTNVTVRSFSFTPSSVTINVGDTVTWTAADSGHNTQRDATPESWASPFLTPGGASFSRTFNTPGTFAYFCSPHRTFMTGTVIVRAPATAPSITAEPQDLTVNVATTATFSVTATGTEPLTYQWLFNENPIGGNSSSLSIPNAQPANQGPYRVVINNSAGSITSRVASLTVNVPNQPPQVQITSPSDGASFPSGSDILITASASDPDGTINQVTFFVDSNPQGADSTSPYTLTLSAAAAGSYIVSADASDNQGSSASSTPITITVTNIPAGPNITSQPQSQTVPAGGNATFTVRATGTGTLRYRWQFNQNDLPDATNDSLTISNAQPANAGNYRVIVSDAAGSSISSEVALSLTQPQNVRPSVRLLSPTNGAVFVEGENIVFVAEASDSDGSIRLVEFFDGIELIGSATNSPYTFSTTNLSVGSHFISAAATDNQFASSNSPSITLNVVNPSQLPSITGQPQGQTVNVGANVTFSVNASGPPPISYQWQLNRADIPGATDPTLALTNVQHTQEGNYRVVVRNNAGSTNSAEAELVVIETPPNMPPTASLISPTNGAVFGTNQNILLSANASDADGSILEVQFFRNGNLLGTVTSGPPYQFTTKLQAGTHDLTARAIDNQSSSGTSETVTIVVTETLITVPPAIVQQPQSTNVLSGQTATFSVQATGTEPLSYQWRRNEANIAGATSSTLTLANVASANAGNYSVVVSNAGGTVTSSNAVLTVTILQPDPTRPSVTITAPTTGFRSTNRVVQFRGSARDNNAVARVLLTVDSNEVFTAAGGSNWTASLNLTPGSHLVSVRSFDLAGNASPAITRRVIVLSQVSVQVVGGGTLSPNLNGRFLEVGKIYRMTAVPQAGQIFSDWSGTVTSSNAALGFVMGPEMSLTATFVPNLFPGVKGTYNGLFLNPTNTEFFNSGFVSLILRDKGGFSGKVLLAGKSHPITGQFRANGQTSIPVLRRGTTPVVLALQVDLTGGSDQITGSVTGAVSNETWVTELVMDRAVRNSRSNPALEAGRYTFFLPNTQEEPQIPAGNSIGTATIDGNGNISMQGTMSDNTAMTQRVPISKNGRWPLYVSLYQGRGEVIGWIQFTSNSITGTNRLMDGTVYWIKPGLATNQGFILTTQADGSAYRAGNLRGQRSLIIGGADFQELVFQINVGANNLVTVVSGPSLSLRMSLNNISGLYNGTFRHPVGGRTISFKGVFILSENAGYGFFGSGGQTGYANLPPSSEP